MAAREDVAVEVLTTDAAGPGRGDRLNVDRGPIRFAAGYDVTYARRVVGRDVSPALLAHLVPAMRRADVVHLTATYSFPTLPTLAMAKAMNKPLLWSPRGALQARQEWKAAQSGAKVLFERACQLLIPKMAMLHVTSEAEKAASQRLIPDIPAAVVPNAVPLSEDLANRVYRPDGRLRIVFLSRIHPKKGLETLIDAIATAGERLSNGTLDVYGTGEADYVATLQARAADRAIADRVAFHGHVEGAEKTAAFLAADVFVLPSWSENFGIVVAEALSFRVPTITTTITPWAETVGEGCGLQVPAGDVDALAAALLEINGRNLAAMGEVGRGFVVSRFSSEAIAAEMASVYHDLAARDIAAYT